MPSLTITTPGNGAFPTEGKLNIRFKAWSAGGQGATGDLQDAGGGGGGGYAEGTIPLADYFSEGVYVAINYHLGDGSDSENSGHTEVIGAEHTLTIQPGGSGGDTAGGAGGAVSADSGNWSTATHTGGAGGTHPSGVGTSSGSGGGSSAGPTSDGNAGVAGGTTANSAGAGGAAVTGGGAGGAGGTLNNAGGVGSSPGGGSGGSGDAYVGARAAAGNGKIIFLWDVPNDPSAIPQDISQSPTSFNLLNHMRSRWRN